MKLDETLEHERIEHGRIGRNRTGVVYLTERMRTECLARAPHSSKPISNRFMRNCDWKLVIGAASRVRYSATVTALTAEDAHTVLEEGVVEAKNLQHRLPVLIKEADALKVGGRGSVMELRRLRAMVSFIRGLSDH